MLPKPSEFCLLLQAVSLISSGASRVSDCIHTETWALRLSRLGSNLDISNVPNSIPMAFLRAMHISTLLTLLPWGTRVLKFSGELHGCIQLQ